MRFGGNPSVGSSYDSLPVIRSGNHFVGITSATMTKSVNRFHCRAWFAFSPNYPEAIPTLSFPEK